MNIGAAAAKRPPIPGAHHRFLSKPSMRPIRGCIQRGFCAAFPAACPAPQKKFAPDGCRYCSFEGLGVYVHSLAAHEFTLAYFRRAKKFHPGRGNRDGHELMARINAARTAILKAHQLRRR
jgi:hypothetical protein